MNDDLPERDLLRIIDPAAAHPVEEDARLHNLLTVLDRIEPERRPARTLGLRGRLALAIPTGVLLVGAAVLVPVLTATPPPTAPPTTSTVGTPTALLAGSVTRGGVTILAETTVGTSQFLLGQLGDDTRFGASFNGSDPDDNWETFGAAPPATEDAVTVASASNFPDAAPEGIATLTGRLGSGVAGLTVTTRDSGTATAVTSGGYFIAAWIGPEFSGPGVTDPYVTTTYIDGSSTSVPFSDLLPD